MADEIGASVVPMREGGLAGRLVSAATSWYEGPVLLEGGAPLAEGAALDVMNRVDGPLLMLAADETLIDCHRALPYYSRRERLAHLAALSRVDGVIAVSARLRRLSQRQFGIPAELARPFVTEPLGDELGSLMPDVGGSTVLCVAEDRPAFDLDMLHRACGSRDLVVAGEGTGRLDAGVGWVERDRLVCLYLDADVFVLPAVAGAFPVAPVEAMRAGTPAVVTEGCGTAELVEQVDQRLVAPCTERGVRRAVNWYLGLDLAERRRLSRRARELSRMHSEEAGLANFSAAWDRLLGRVR
jgi:glycosyltransferase involved in cell wall biosynthesis